MLARFLLLSLMLAGAGCGDNVRPTGAADAAADADVHDDAAAPADAGPYADLRGKRYCEVLVATLDGSNVHVEVYNTQGLNECPADAWSQLDADALAADLGVLRVILNGPRYWMIDAFVQGELVDPTPRAFGGLMMRHAADIDLPVAEAMAMQAPYTQRTIQRRTTVRFAAGAPVFELEDADGHVYEMQSYSVQQEPLAEAELATLGPRLTLPDGWTYRTRVLEADLDVTAVDGLATVVQDDFANTYQQSH